jgi:chemotaxis protein methyltransferase CheR
MVQWRKFNLLESFAPLGQFDIVFCRNVLIYFDQPTKSDILSRIARQMPTDGYLMLGAAETVVGLSEAFKPAADRRSLYYPNAAAPAKLATATQPAPTVTNFPTTRLAAVSGVKF